MTGAFGRTKKTMDSSEYTRIKKASAIFRIPESENIVSSNSLMVLFVPENLSRTIQIISKNSIGGIMTITFEPDPENPNRFIQSTF